MTPTGHYWIGDLAASLGAGALALALGVVLVAWLTGLDPAAIVTTVLDRLLGR